MGGPDKVAEESEVTGRAEQTGYVLGHFTNYALSIANLPLTSLYQI
jgi:hypothetical protein